MSPLNKNNQSHPAEKGYKTTLIGVTVSVILVIVKATAGIIGNSFALVADAIESLGDIFTAVVMYAGLKKATQPPDENHPYGHGKAEPIAAITVVIGLVLAAGFIAYQGIVNISTPHESPEWYTLLVLAVVIVTKELLSRYISGVGDSIESRAIKADAFHHRSDAITSGAAFIGISIALAGGGRYEIADDVAALVAAGIILFNVYFIARPAIGELMDERHEAEWIDEVEKVALSHPDVQSIEKLRVRKLGFDLYMDFHLRVRPELSVEAGHEVTHQVKEELLKLHPYLRDVLIHLEPESSSDLDEA